LPEPLSLDILAGVASFSKYHFHRMFHAAVGETLADYVSRLRLHKAAYLLLIAPRRSVTDIALECGFSGPALFAKKFKARFGMTASDWRIQKRNPDELREPESRAYGRAAGPPPRFSVAYGNGVQTWTTNTADGERVVRVETVPEMTLAYIRHTGPYKGDSALFVRLFKKLFAWLGPRNLVFPHTTKIFVLYHEYPDITPEEQLRLNVCCTVPSDTSGEGEVGVMTFSPRRCAISRFVCGAEEYQRAWDWMYDTWLPSSGCMPADVPAFERYEFDAYDPATGKMAVDICVPVQPL
jgi:AraC family transcriptional regulator